MAISIDRNLPARLERDEASRPVDWRWQRVTMMRADQRYASVWRRDNDEEIAELHKFQAAIASASDGFQMLVIKRTWPRLYTAHAYWSDKPNRLAKWELEARLLSGETNESIARKFGFKHPKTVDWYEKAFFNVRDRRNDKSYIVNTLLGESIHVGMSERDLELLWKILGYHQGPGILDILCHKDFSIPGPEKFTSLTQYCQAEIEANVSVKAALAARIMAANSFSQPLIMETWRGIQELNKMADNGAGRGPMEECLMAVFKGLPFQIGGRPSLRSASDADVIVGRLPPKVADIDSSALELRDDELLELTAGSIDDTL